MVVLADVDGVDAICADSAVFRQTGLLDDALLGAEDHEVALAELRVAKLADAEASADSIARFDVEHVLDGSSFALLVAVGNVIDLEPVAASAVGEEEHRVVHRGGIDLLDEVVVARRACFDADAAAALCLELCQGNSLDVAHVAHRNDYFVVGIEVFGVELLGAGQNLRATCVAVLFLYLDEFVLDDLAAKGVVGENLVVVLNLLQQFVVLIMEVFLPQACELRQTHIDDGLALQFVQLEAGFEVALGVGGRLAATYDVYHLVDVVRGDDEAFEDVRSLFGFAEVVLCATDDDIVAMLDEVADEVLEGEQLRPSLHEGDAVDAEAGLQRRHLEELVQHDACVGVALQVNHDAHAFRVALVVDVADAFYLLVAHELCDVLDELLFVDAIGYLADDYLVVRVAALYVGFGAEDNASAAGLVGIADALHAHDVGAGGEVGAFHVVHEVIYRKFAVIDVSHAGVDDFAEVVRRDVGCHADGNAGGSVDEQIGDARRHDGRLAECVVEVGRHVNGLLLQVVHHGFAHEAEPCLGVSHGSGAVAIDAAEVALAVNKRVAHSPFLSHADEGHIDRAVAMRVILTEHLAHDTGTFLIRAAVEIAKFAHAVQNAAVNRLEAVPDIWQGTGYDDAHRVVDVALLHLLLNVNFNYSFLIIHWV